MLNQHLKQKNTGFTLIETIVAIAVLALAITAPLTLAYRSINATNIARDQVVATFLAQDAMEYILAQRDFNRISGGSWLDGLDCDSGCRIDTTEDFGGDGISTSSIDQVLKYSEDDGYNYDSGTDTKFSREIVFDAVSNNGDERVVDVTVKWNSGVLNREFTLTTHIFNSSS